MCAGNVPARAAMCSGLMPPRPAKFGSALCWSNRATCSGSLRHAAQHRLQWGGDESSQCASCAEAHFSPRQAASATKGMVTIDLSMCHLVSSVPISSFPIVVSAPASKSVRIVAVSPFVIAMCNAVAPVLSAQFVMHGVPLEREKEKEKEKERERESNCQPPTTGPTSGHKRTRKHMRQVPVTCVKHRACTNQLCHAFSMCPLGREMQSGLVSVADVTALACMF
eukprot:COSAG01_NODE_13446_length_1584_cov_98.390572_1_plen_223_part_10